MKDVVVIGAGKIGSTVAQLLAATGDYNVTLVDRSAEVLAARDRDERIHAVAVDVERQPRSWSSSSTASSRCSVRRRSTSPR